ncbi:MAG: GC-type dockerin domain-anchored protein [Phycisphaerales bacterium]
MNIHELNGSAMKSVVATSATIALLSFAAPADTFDATVDSNTSTASLSGTVELHTTGTLIGDYNSETNPDGTSTIPGFFGGSGNNPIGIELVGAVVSDINASPTGAMMIDLDLDNLTIDITGLEIDLLGGQSGAAQPTVSMVYDTFHTQAPSFIYPGGIPFEFPLGDASTIDQAIASQTGSGVGVLTPTDDPDIFEFQIALPAELSLAFSLGFGDIQTPDDGFAPLPIILPLDGLLHVQTDGSLLMTITVDPQELDQSTPIEDVTTPEIPFELPTLGTETAGVLLTLDPDELAVMLGYSSTLQIIATPASCLPDFNNDGSLDFFDISAFLSAFSSSDLSADLTGDGDFDFFDISAFLTAFAAGCP